MLTLFKIAPQGRQDKDRPRLSLPRACPVKALFQRSTTLRCAVPELAYNTS
jgi:hypothetical protein